MAWSDHFASLHSDDIIFIVKMRKIRKLLPLLLIGNAWAQMTFEGFDGLLDFLQDENSDLSALDLSQNLTARGKRKKFREQNGCDEDQCLNAYACDPNATCQNKCKGYTCYCHTGYTKKGKKCVSDCDENQCEMTGIVAYRSILLIFDWLSINICF